MKILAIGDIVGIKSVDYLADRLFRVKAELGADMVIANGENATEIHGVSKKEALAIFDAGVDVITLGNHTYRKADICEVLGSEANIIRPANYPPMAPGAGHIIVSVKGKRVLCINVLGVAFMEPLACPFETVDRILGDERGNYDLAILDIHAEATSEKIALGRYFDGKINIIFGTHTHVATADEQILPHGTGYISDVGMCGESGGILGMDAETVVLRMRSNLPYSFKAASGKCRADGVIFTLDTSKGVITEIERISF